MAIALREFSVPLALLLITVLVYLLIIGKLSGWTFASSLVGVALLVAVVAVVLPRSEEVSELGGKVAGQEILVKMEKVRADIYVKAEVIQRLTEHLAEISAFNLTHLGRFSPKNLDELLLKERDRLVDMLKRAGIQDNRVIEITYKITDVVIGDLARDVWRAVPKEMFTVGGAKGQNQIKKFHGILLSSKVGTAEQTAHDFLKPMGGWTSDVKLRAVEFDEFRKTGMLPAHRTGPEED
jgi:hypothetical protein